MLGITSLKYHNKSFYSVCWYQRKHFNAFYSSKKVF